MTLGQKLKRALLLNKIISCPVSQITDQGIILNVENKYEGFIPLSELTWLKKPPHPSKIIETTQN